jgi:hypothetical protein
MLYEIKFDFFWNLTMIFVQDGSIRYDVPLNNDFNFILKKKKKKWVCR